MQPACTPTPGVQLRTSNNTYEETAAAQQLVTLCTSCNSAKSLTAFGTTGVLSRDAGVGQNHARRSSNSDIPSKPR